MSARICADDLRALYAEFSKSSKVWEKEEYPVAAKLACVLHDFLSQRFQAVIETQPLLPLLVSYSSDATSFLTKRRVSHPLGPELVQRHGHELSELLLERGFVKSCEVAGSSTASIQLAAPRILSNGKTNQHLFTAAVEFIPAVRETHKGILVLHVAFDRAVFAGLARSLHSWRAAMHVEGFRPACIDELLYGEVLDWFVGTACCYHDFHGGYRWAMMQHSSAEILRSLFIGIESVRNSFAMISKQVPLFIMRFLTYTDDTDDYSDVVGFWSRMGIPADHLDMIAAANPRWDGSALLVSSSVRSRPDPVGMVQGIILYIFKFQKFSESRWLQTGVSSRGVVAAISVWLLQVMRMVRADPHNTDYHAHGIQELTVPVKKHACIASLVTFVCETAMAMVLQEERLLRIADELEESIQQEVEFLVATSAYTWNRLSAVIGDPSYTTADLMSDCLLGGHVSAAFIARRVLSELKGYPWALARGDIEQNLRDLDAHPDPKGPRGLDAGCGQKAKRLLTMKYPFQLLVKGARMLLDVIWGTRSVEQGHGSCAVIHRVHKLLTPVQLAVRSLLHQARAFFSRCPEEQSLARLRTKLDRLKAKKAQYNGRQVYMKELMDEVSGSLPVGAKLPASLRQAVVQYHGAMHRVLPASAQARYDEIADETSRRMQDTARGDIEHLEDEMALFVSRFEQEKREKAKTNIITGHRFSDTDVQALLELWESPLYDRETVNAKILQHVSPPEAPAKHVVDFFKSCEVVEPRVVSKMEASWQKRLCAHRQHLTCTVFGLAEDSFREGQEHFAFLYGVQTPQEAWFMRVSRTIDAIGLQADRWHLHRFVCEHGTYLPHDKLPLRDGDALIVIEGLAFQADGTLAGGALPQKLHEWELGWPLPETTQGTHGTSVSKPKLQELKDKHPWLEACLEAPRSSTRTWPCGASSSAEPPAEDVDAEAALIRAWQDLEESHRALAPASATGDEFFIRVSESPCASAASVRTTVAVEAKRGVPREYCRRYSLLVASSWSADRYGLDAAMVMASELRERQQHYYLIWATDMDFERRFSAAELHSYVESVDWIAFKASLPVGSAALGRCHQIEAAIPANP